jgi:choline kinase
VRLSEYGGRVLIHYREKEMKLVIMMAGSGRRLGTSLTKAMLEFDTPSGKQTLLDMMVNSFKPYIDEAILIVGYKSIDIINHVIKKVDGSINYRFIYNEQYRSTGTRYSLLQAAEYFSGQDCIIAEGDILFHPNIATKLMQSPQKNLILVDESWKPPYTGEVLLCGRNGVIDYLFWKKHCKKLPDMPTCLGSAIDVIKMNKHISKVFAQALRVSQNFEYLEALNLTVAMAEFNYNFILGSPWAEIDTPEDLIKAREVNKKIWNLV